MTAMIQSDQQRAISLGVLASKVYTPLLVETKTLFNVTGIALVTSIVGYVTTIITVANTVKLQANPTVGTTQDLCAATDIGTTDTPAGDLLTISGAPTAPLNFGVGAVQFGGTQKVATDYLGGGGRFYVATGTIEQVTASGADGGITWYLTYVPITSGSSIAAA